MIPEYKSRIESLTPSEAGLVAGELCRRRVLPAGLTPRPGSAMDPGVLIGALTGSHLLAADVVAALLSVPGPLAQNAIEKILGRPVTNLPPQAAPPPAPRHEGAPPPVVASGPYSRKKIVEVAANPKRAGTGAHERFAIYREEMTVAEYLAAGGQVRDVSWDVKQGYVKVVDV